MLRNIVPHSNGAVNKVPTMIWMLPAEWIPERVHSKCEELHAMAMSNLCCEEARPLTGEVGDMQHPFCVGHCGIQFGVLLQNTQWEKWLDQNIRFSERSKPSGHRGSTCLHWKLLPRPEVDIQHHMSWSVPLTSSTCIQATCGLIPCQALIWSIHSAFAIVTVVGPALWGLLFSAHSIVIPLRQGFQQVCLRAPQ